MSETNVQNVDQHALVDLFPDLGSPSVGDKKVSFGGTEGTIDLFQQPPAPAPTLEIEKKPEEERTDPIVEDKDKKESQEPDILGTGSNNPPPATGTAISDLAGYYQDRIKNGKFVPIDIDDEKGNSVPFIPKTAEEYDEVLELQIQYRLDEAKKDMEKKWFSSKSPAWQAVSRYSELLDDPTQMIPFLSNVRTMASVANLDENENDGAEQIVRTRLLQNGDTEEIISQQIQSLKTTDTLKKTAQLYKPLIIQQEQAALQTQMREKQEQDRQYKLLVNEIRDNALKSIEAPVFGKTKLKNEEKAAIYDLIAEPVEETQGYGIYSVIDNLFEKKDFEKLKELALLLTNRDAFMSYLGTSVANATAAQLERKLRLAGEARKSSGNDFHEEQQQARITRDQFKSKPTFGR